MCNIREDKPKGKKWQHGETGKKLIFTYGGRWFDGVGIFVPQYLRCGGALRLTVENDGVPQVNVDDVIRCHYEGGGRVYVQMEPGAVLVLVRRPIEKYHFTFVPTRKMNLDFFFSP